MNNYYNDPWATHDAGGYGLDDTDEVYYPPPGSADLIIKDNYEPLFTSATWTLLAIVNKNIIASTQPSDKPHSDAFIKRWSRHMIRTNYETLKSLGVDIEKAYTELGGSMGDF